MPSFEPNGATQETAYDKWSDHTSAREEARRDRVHGADGIILSTLWIVLLLGAAILLLYMLFPTQGGERSVAQALQVGAVGAALLLVRQLNQPFHSWIGGLRPTAMERTLYTLEIVLADEGGRSPLPCSEAGQPLRDDVKSYR